MQNCWFRPPPKALFQADLNAGLKKKTGHRGEIPGAPFLFAA
ncbi:hypothetical protein AmDm5_2496 [Acetobacter malorum]|nr:hypothetical protein AmDm5_2496 [Acetobacter malorum]